MLCFPAVFLFVSVHVRRFEGFLCWLVVLTQDPQGSNTLEPTLIALFFLSMALIEIFNVIVSLVFGIRYVDFVSLWVVTRVDTNVNLICVECMRPLPVKISRV